MKRLLALLVSALVLAAGTAFAARSSRSAGCLIRCESSRPTAADRKKYQDCLKPHVQEMKPRVASLKRQTRAAREAAWKAIHQAREATVSRCAAAHLKAWTDCLKQCRGGR